MDEGQARNPNTTYNGLKWNSGSLLDMEAHMPSATQNNSKRTKRNNQERRNILNHNGPKANLQLNTSPPAVIQRNNRV